MEDREEDSGPSGAEQAFEELRAEVKVLRRAVEALPEAWAANRPANYTETLGAIAKKLEILASHLQAIEQHPAIRMTPAQHQRAIAAAGEGLMHNAVQKLDSATAEAVKERRELAGLIGSMRGQRASSGSGWLWTGRCGVLVGVIDLAGVRAMVALWARWPRRRVHHAGRSLERGRRVDAGAESGGLARPRVCRGAADGEQSGVSGLSRCGGEDEEGTALRHHRGCAVNGFLRICTPPFSPRPRHKIVRIRNKRIHSGEPRQATGTG